MFWQFLVSNPKIMNFIKFIIKKTTDSNRVPSFIKKIVGKISLRFVLGVMPYLFNAVVSHAEKNRSKTASNDLQRTLGYDTAEHLSDRQKMAIHVQMKNESYECKYRKCVLTLTGESCSPFETIHCETCGENICSLKVDYITEPFNKKYMGLKD